MIRLQSNVPQSVHMLAQSVKYFSVSLESSQDDVSFSLSSPGLAYMYVRGYNSSSGQHCLPDPNDPNTYTMSTKDQSLGLLTAIGPHAPGFGFLITVQTVTNTQISLLVTLSRILTQLQVQLLMLIFDVFSSTLLLKQDERESSDRLDLIGKSCGRGLLAREPMVMVNF